MTSDNSPCTLKKNKTTKHTTNSPVVRRQLARIVDDSVGDGQTLVLAALNQNFVVSPCPLRLLLFCAHKPVDTHHAIHTAPLFSKVWGGGGGGRRQKAAGGGRGKGWGEEVVLGF